MHRGPPVQWQRAPRQRGRRAREKRTVRQAEATFGQDVLVDCLGPLRHRGRLAARLRPGQPVPHRRLRRRSGARPARGCGVGRRSPTSAPCSPSRTPCLPGSFPEAAACGGQRAHGLAHPPGRPGVVDQDGRMALRARHRDAVGDVAGRGRDGLRAPGARELDVDVHGSQVRRATLSCRTRSAAGRRRRPGREEREDARVSGLAAPGGNRDAGPGDGAAALRASASPGHRVVRPARA